VEELLWERGGWEALRDDIDAEIKVKQKRIRNLRRARALVEQNLTQGTPFPQPTAQGSSE